MGNVSNCSCRLCAIERNIGTHLALPENQNRFRELVERSPALNKYSTVKELIARLHDCRTQQSNGNGSDEIFGTLLAAAVTPEDADYLEGILLLALMPAVHANVRQVALSYPFLSREDIAQHGLVTLIQFLRSPHWRTRTSHFAFSATRKLKRNLFLWACNEFRSTSDFAANQLGDTIAFAQTADESFERLATLRRFLSLCYERAYLDADDLNLLFELKLDGTLNSEASSSTDRGSNALRQKLKRLMNKLREHARAPNMNNHHDRRFP